MTEWLCLIDKEYRLDGCNTALYSCTCELDPMLMWQASNPPLVLIEISLN